MAFSDAVRHRRRRGREVPFENIPAPAGHPENERRQELFDAIRRLELIERQLAWLYLEGLTAREIGDVLGITEGNVAVRLTRLRQQLSNMLNKQEAQPGGATMIEQDDLQKLWQNDGVKREDSIMWRQLVHEKRSGWVELMRTEDQAWYLIALCFVPLTVWAAWNAKYPWIHVGFAVMAATFALATIGTWIAGRERLQRNDSSLREHLEALLESYDRRSRLIRHGGGWVMGGLSAGLAAIFLGMPGSVTNPRSWIITILSVAGANAAMWLSCKQSATKIFRKRDEAARLLNSLLAGGQVPR